MRFGLNLLLWCDTLEDAILPVLEEIKGIGYDAVEIPIFEYDVAKYAHWGKRLDELGLARTGVTIRLPGNNPISPDAAERRKGVDGQQGGAGLCGGRRLRGAGRAVPFGPGLFHRRRADGRRMAVGRRQHAASGRARREGQRQPGPGVSQPLRVLLLEHRGRRGAVLPRRGPSRAAR